MSKKWIKTLLLSTFGLQALAQPMDKAKLDAYFDALASNDKFMGSVAVFQEGKLLYKRSIGFADLAKGLKTNDQTEFRIGSITKTFTAVMVFKAIEAGKLQPEQTIDKWFPQIPNAGKITIDMLLHHRSGIANFTDLDAYQIWQTSAKTEAQLIDTIAQAGSNFEPDSHAAYSNSNFVLLGYILEKIYKTSYAKLLHNEIIDPLGLQHTHYGGKIDISKNQANSYDYPGHWELHTETDMSIPGGAGAIISTPTDLDAFITALFDGKLVNASSLESMKTIQDHLGRGLVLLPFGTRRAYGHSGGIDGFSSMLGYFPEDKVAFAMTVNGKNYNTNDVAIAVLSSVFNKPYSIPEFSSYNASAEDLQSYTGIYSSAQVPLKITVTVDNNILMAQATGQSAFPLDATAPHKFQFIQAGIEMEFDPAAKTMLLKQGGATFNFHKD